MKTRHPHPVGANSFAHIPGNRLSRANKFAPTALVLALSAAFTLPPHAAHAAPQGGQVVAGQATIAQPNANTTTITQSTQKAIIDWQSFSIAANQHTQFIQPSAASVTLNRVVGVDPSQILGRLTANGQVFLVNPNGIYFGKNAQIDVAGLIATTHNIRNADFLAGNYQFNIPGKPGAAVINDGMIHIADTGIAAFVAPSVANRGVVVARLGKVMLASANGFTLDFSGDQLISFLVNDQVAQTAFDLQGKPLTSFVENAGQIQAQGGYILLTAKAAETAIHSVINQTGSIEATTVGTHNGTIILNAGTGSLNVAGTLDASASLPPTAGLPSPASGRGVGGEGNGGFIETSGAHVKIDPNANITTAAPLGKAGTWLIDPVNFTIAATNGDMTGAQLTSALGLNNVIIQSINGAAGATGDINVNDVVNWSANKLTLNAQNNIYINSLLNGSGTASLALEYGQQALAAGNTSDYIIKSAVNLPAGQNFSTRLGSDGVVKNYTVITSLGAAGSTTGTDLQGINGNLSGNYALGASIDATPTATWNGGTGFQPIHNGAPLNVNVRSSVMFDGLGHVISNLTVNNPPPPGLGLLSGVGLFGVLYGFDAVIQNVGVIGGNVVGMNNVGQLVGYMQWGTVKNCYATGNTTGNTDVGGLVGYNLAGTVTNSFATGSVSGGSNVGGLVGRNATNGGTQSVIFASHATGNVTGGNLGGALGGLVGTNNGSVSNSYALGNVTSTNVNMNTYDLAGGLVGDNTGTITNTYALGAVTGGSGFGSGPLVGSNWNVIASSYWNTDTTLRSNVAGNGLATLAGTPLTNVTSLTTAQMQQQASYVGWDFVNTWQITPNAYPTLKAVPPSPPAQNITPPPAGGGPSVGPGATAGAAAGKGGGVAGQTGTVNGTGGTTQANGVGGRTQPSTGSNYSDFTAQFKQEYVKPRAESVNNMPSVFAVESMNDSQVLTGEGSTANMGQITENIITKEADISTLDNAIASNSFEAYVQSKVQDQEISTGISTLHSMMTSLMSNGLFGKYFGMNFWDTYLLSLDRAIQDPRFIEANHNAATGIGKGLVFDVFATVIGDELKARLAVDANTTQGAFEDYGVDVLVAAIKDFFAAGFEAKSAQTFVVAFQIGFASDMAAMAASRIIKAVKLAIELHDTKTDMYAGLFKAAKHNQNAIDEANALNEQLREISKNPNLSERAKAVFRAHFDKKQSKLREIGKKGKDDVAAVLADYEGGVGKAQALNIVNLSLKIAEKMLAGNKRKEIEVLLETQIDSLRLNSPFGQGGRSVDIAFKMAESFMGTAPCGGGRC